MFPKIGSTIAAGLVLVHASSGTARAQDVTATTVIEIRNGDNAGKIPIGENGKERALKAYYPGSEHANVYQLADGSLMMFFMSSYDIAGEPVYRRVQMACAHIGMDPIVGAKLLTLKYITHENGTRYPQGHHPQGTPVDYGTAVAVTHNWAKNNHAEAYQTVFGPGCEQLSERIKIMAKNNDNCSETGEKPEVVVEQTATETRLLSVHGCNGNGKDDAWMTGTTIIKNLGATGLGSYTVIKRYEYPVEKEEERTRREIVLTDEPNFAMVCLSEGNSQPTNSIVCSGHNTAKNVPAKDRLLYRKYIAKREGKIRQTQVRIASILVKSGDGYAPTNKVMLTWTELIKKRGRSRKGQATRMSAVVTATSQGITLDNVPQKTLIIGGDATHQASCSTMYGTVGSEQPRTFISAGSINGAAAPKAQNVGAFVGFDVTTGKMSVGKRVGLGTSIDSGWLFNIYGQNPNTQGRNFVGCTMIKNPHFGTTGAWAENVKNFVAIAATTRRERADQPGEREDKLALELVLIPAVTAGPTGQNTSSGSVTK